MSGQSNSSQADKVKKKGYRKMICEKCKAESPESPYCPQCGKKQVPEPRKHIKRANNTGTVYKLSGRRRRPWVAAKSGVIIGYYEKKTDALDALGNVAQRNVTERYNMTFAEVYESWNSEHFRTLTDSGETGYRSAYDQFAEIHAKAFRTLRTMDFQRCVDDYAAGGRKHSTVSKLKQLVGQMSKWAIREEIIQTNFAPYIILPEYEPVEKEIFDDAEIEKLENCLDDAAKITLMLIYTGMRIGELFTMPVADVHKTYCIGGEKTEAGMNRVIPIPLSIRPYFSYFKSLSKDCELLLDGYEGNRELHNFRKRDYYPLLESLGIKRKTPHSTRHTYASMAVKVGMRPEDLQQILGHADYGTTSNIYVHSNINDLVKAANKLKSKTKKEKKETVEVTNMLLTNS